MRKNYTLTFNPDGTATRSPGTVYTHEELKTAEHRLLSSDYLPDNIKAIKEYKNSRIIFFKLKAKRAFAFVVVGDDNTILFRCDIVNGFADI